MAAGLRWAAGHDPFAEGYSADYGLQKGVAALLLVCVIAAAMYYLITRLRFAFFHCLVHNTKVIRPGWELYKEQASRFFWLNIASGRLFSAAGGADLDSVCGGVLARVS